MARWALPVLALTAAVVLAVVIWFALVEGDVGGEPAPRGAESTRDPRVRLGVRQERPEPLSAQVPHPGREQGLRGRVVNGTGEGVAGARVFLLPKRVPGTDSVRVLTRSKADGSFGLPAGDWAGHWIGVRAAGFGLLHVDAESPPSDLVLPPGLALDLELVAEETLPTQTVRLDVRSLTGETWLYPGPGALATVERVVELPLPGRHSFFLPTSAGVEVVCDGARLAWTPRRSRVEALPATLQVVFAPSARVIVRVRQDDPRGPYLDEGRLSAVDLATGDEVDVREGRGSGGRHVIQRQLRPGLYRFVFEAPGFLPWSSDEITLPGEKGELTLKARLVRDTELGEVSLDTESLHRVAWRRSGHAEGEWRGAHIVRGAQGIRLRGMPTGRVDLLLWQAAGAGAQVAFLDGVDVGGPDAQDVKPAWRAGTILQTTGTEEDVFRVAHERLGALPAYRAGRPPRAGQAWPREAGGAGQVLGPYPLPDVALKNVERR